mmetsp:Transcript_68231/g.181589  ORF Transcript_68231/g.181589 Transcript_68231/m.181589 type:complete len:243 (+) Transcript_68231:192-920(+)
MVRRTLLSMMSAKGLHSSPRLKSTTVLTSNKTARQTSKKQSTTPKEVSHAASCSKVLAQFRRDLKAPARPQPARAVSSRSGTTKVRMAKRMAKKTVAPSSLDLPLASMLKVIENIDIWRSLSECGLMRFPRKPFLSTSMELTTDPTARRTRPTRAASAVPKPAQGVASCLPPAASSGSNGASSVTCPAASSLALRPGGEGPSSCAAQCVRKAEKVTATIRAMEPNCRCMKRFSSKEPTSRIW